MAAIFKCGVVDPRRVSSPIDLDGNVLMNSNRSRGTTCLGGSPWLERVHLYARCSVVPVVLLCCAFTTRCSDAATAGENDPCEKSTLRISYETTLQTAQVSLRQQTQVIRDRRGHYYAAPTYDPGLIVKYSSAGAPVALLGKQGSGPGEFRDIRDIKVVGGDTLMVFDPMNSRMTFLDPEGRYARSFAIRVPTAKTFPTTDGRIVAEASGRESQPFMLLSATGEIMTRFGKQGAIANFMSGAREVAVTRDYIYAVRRDRYKIDRFTLSGDYERSISRRPDWFPGFDPKTAIKQEFPKVTMLIDAAADASGNLILLAARRKEDAKLPNRLQGAHNEFTRFTRMETDQTTDYYIDLVNPERNCRLATMFVPTGVPAGFIDENRLFAQRESKEGEIIFDVWRISYSPKRGERQ